jgi:translation initiation factor 3 subunit F
MSKQVDTLTVNLSTAPYQRAFTTSVSPVVLFTGLDHFLRRDDGQNKVVGAILGVRSQSGTEVEIRNAMPLIYNKKEQTIDDEHYRSMYELHQRVNPEEIVLGWYTAGTALSPSATPLHASFADDTAPFQPIHLTIDTDALMKTDDMGVRAYVRYRIALCLDTPLLTSFIFY